MWGKVFWANTFLRIVTPFTIFNFPIAATIVSFLLDTVDSEFAFRAKFSWGKYSTIDKLLDYWWYIFILIYTLSFNIFPVFFILFCIRSVGQLLFFLTRKEIFFVIFPNVFEVFFIFYLFLPEIPLKSALIISIFVTFFREYLVHLRKAAPFSPQGYVKWHKGK